MIFARDPRALLCLNLRKEWAADQRDIAAALERQAWCLDQARQSSWPVFHAHEARGRGLNHAVRGALRGLAPQRSEPVFVVGDDALFANDTLQEAFRAAATQEVFVLGIGRSAALARAGVAVRVIEDAFIEVGEASTTVLRLKSADAFKRLSADVVELGVWRSERTRANEG